ncbi:MAG: dicarboxylate/amino acid:cation symporter [Gemmatimonadaceae bacterium]|nr:dicarboxylate/amino acid:cation symporter [Gemmatimonadaceae bacterium]
MTAHVASAPAPKKGFLSPTQQIVVAMIVGILVGYLFPASEYPQAIAAFKVGSSVFLRLIKTLIVPLLFSTLVVGIAGHGDDMKKVGRLAFRSIIYFEIVTTLALAVGLIAVNLVRPGDGITLSDASAQTGTEYAATKVTFASVMEHMVPQSFFEAASKNEVLQIVVFTILFAVGLSRVEGKPKQIMLDWCDALAQVMFKFTGLVMAFAPIGIGCAIAVTVGSSGLAVLKSLAILVLTLYGALIVFALAVLLPTALIARVPVKRFWSYVKEPWLIAFSTASSEAALPKAMENLEKFGIPRRIIAFVLPTGYSFNLDGSTLYLAVAAVFAAQAGGIELSIGKQLVIMLTLMLTSKGVAGVPRASLVILSGALAMFDLPLEAIALILGVDAIMDMARTSINLLGNCLATAVMARWEGEFPDDQTAMLS